MQRVLLLGVVLALANAARGGDIPFDGTLRIPALERIWHELNRPAAAEMELDWRPVDSRKDLTRPDDFWRQWPTPFSPFYAGVKLPADAFTLAQLYPGNKLVYPHATYEGNPDYETFFDLHESLAWLYALDSPGNPYFKSRGLRLRAQQLALAHLVGMTQSVPGGIIIGGWMIQYGNCVAWNAHVLKRLDDVEPLDPALKAAWIDCLDFILRTLDAQGPEKLQTGMGHWNLWPVCGAFYLWQASGDERHKALFEKWAAEQLEPDRFTSNARYVSGMSPAGYERYSGVDLGYNGQAKNWMAPLFEVLGPDSVVGDFARRQYRFASFVSVEEPDGTLSSPQHMNSHSTQSVPYEQWANHKHLGYAVHLPDARPFAARINPLPATAQPVGPGPWAQSFWNQQQEMANRPIKVLPPMPFGVRSYPSNYLHLPPALAFYPKQPIPRDPIRTRPHEHLAFAQFFASPVVRDEWYVRRTPAYLATIFAGPCKDEVSNAGGRLNGIGSGGLSHVWVEGAGTVLMGYSDLSKTPALDGDFDAVWSQLPVNMLVGQTRAGRIVCSGWTGALMTNRAGDAAGVTIERGIAPAVRGSYGTPITDALHWTRRVECADQQIRVELTADAKEPLQRAEELLPVVFFADTRVTATTADGSSIAAPWDGARPVRAVHVRRGGGGGGGGSGLDVVLPQPLSTSWAGTASPLSGAVGADAKSRALRLDLAPLAKGSRVELRYVLNAIGPTDVPIARVRNGATLSPARIGQPYKVVLEAPAGQPVYWSVTQGKLPPGLTLDRRGLLSGTPTEKGRASFDLRGATPYAGRPFDEHDVDVQGATLDVE
jgi:hypothetical protein